MSTKSLPLGTGWIFLKLYSTIRVAKKENALTSPSSPCAASADRAGKEPIANGEELTINRPSLPSVACRSHSTGRFLVLSHAPFPSQLLRLYSQVFISVFDMTVLPLIPAHRHCQTLHKNFKSCVLTKIIEIAERISSFQRYSSLGFGFGGVTIVAGVRFEAPMPVSGSGDERRLIVILINSHLFRNHCTPSDRTPLYML